MGRFARPLGRKTAITLGNKALLRAHGQIHGHAVRCRAQGPPIRSHHQPPVLQPSRSPPISHFDPRQLRMPARHPFRMAMRLRPHIRQRKVGQVGLPIAPRIGRITAGEEGAAKERELNSKLAGTCAT